MKNFTKKNCHFLKIKYIFLILVFGVFSIALSAQNCTVNAGVQTTVCENEPLFLYGSSSGLFQEADTSITWTQINGPSVLIVSPRSLTTEVFGIVGGESYTFRISTTCLDGSLVYQDVIKHVDAVSDAIVGPDQDMCPGTSALAANSPGTNETGLWSIIAPNNGITITNDTSPTSEIIVSGSSSGNTSLVWTITNSNGCSSTDTVVITNYGGIQPVSAGPDQTLDHCYSTTQSTSLNATYGGSGIGGQIGTWTIVSGPNVPSIANVNSNTTGVSNLIEGVYTFQWDVVGPCANGTDQMIVTVPPPTSDVTNAGGTSGTFIYCDGRTEVVLNGTTPEFTNETVLWTQTAGPAATIVSPTNHITTVTGLDGTSDYSFTYVITNNVTACTSSAVVNVQYAIAPSMDIDLDRVDLTCGESVAVIDYTVTGDGAEAWSIISGPTTPSYPAIPTGYNQINNNPQSISGLTTPGTYIIRFRKSATTGSQCEASFDDVTVIVSYESEFSNAGTDQLLACNIFSTVLAGNAPTVGTGTWSQISGPNTAVINNINQYNSPISGMINGTYVLRWVLSGGPFCLQNQDDVEIVVANTTPNQATVGPDQTVCINTPVYLTGSDPVLNEWGTWSVVPNESGITFSDTTSSNVMVEGLSANSVYTFTWTIENACGSTSADVTITTNNTQGPIIADAGGDNCIASGTSTFDLDGNDPSPGTGLWTLISGPNTPAITNNTIYNTSVTGAVDGTYYFEWAISSGACNPTLDTVKITIAEVATIAGAGADQEICGDQVTMDANNPTIGTGSWVQFAGNGGVTFSDQTANNTVISDLTEGVYRFAWVISNDGCFESADTVVIYVSEPPVAANAGVDQLICGTNQATLAANNVSDGLWSVVSGPNTPSFSDAHSSTAIVSDLIMGTYVLRWTSYGGSFCSPSIDEMEITIVPTANAGADQEYCEATTAVDLVGNNNSIGTWSEVTAFGSSVTTTSGNTATAAGLVSGNVYIFEYEINSGGCQSTDSMTVTLNTPPSVADADADQEYCDAATFTLNGNTPVSGTGEWQLLFSPGGGSFDNASNPAAVFTPTAGSKYGVFVFGWKISNGECSNTDQVRIENFEPPSTSNAGTDQTLTCASEIFMDANDPAVGLGTWTIVSVEGDAPAPTIVSPILYNSLITDLGPQSNGSPADYIFQWTIANGVGLCTPETDQVTITVYETPTPAEAGTDQELCNEVSATMAATAVSTGTGSWSYVSGPAGSVITSVNSESTTITNLAVGTYVFEWQTATAFCSSTDSVTIINYAEPSTPIDLADFAACQFGDLILDTDAPTSGTGLWAQTAGTQVVIIDPTSDSTRVVGVEPGNNYTFRWTVSNGVCADKFDDVTLTVNPEPVASDLSTSECSSVALNIDLLAQVTSPAGGTGVTFTYTVLSSDETNVPAAADRTVATNANITDTYINTTNTLVYISYTVTPISSDGCEGFPFMVDVTINPEPDISNQSTTICSGDALNYSLQNLLPTIMRNGTFIYTVVSSDPGNVAAGADRTVANANNITDTYSNITNSAVDITYSVTPTSVDGCVGNNFDLLVTVNPEPVETGNLTNTVCSDEIINITLPASDDDGLAITGYNISANVDANLSSNTLTTGNNLSGVNVIQNDNFNNITSADHDVVYTITPLAGSCAGASFTVTITVQPEPVLTSGLAETLCADPSTAQATSNLSLTIVNTLSGTTFAYGTPTQTGGMTGGSAGTANPVVQTFTNNTTQPQTATFSVVPTAPNGCAGDATNVVITVNPAAQVDDPGTEVFCNNNAASVTFTTQNTVGTTTYAWTNDNTAIGLGASGNGNLSFTATNAGTSPISANVTVTPTFTYAGQSCPGNPVTFAIVINPTGQVNAISDQELCNNTATTPVPFSTVNTVGTTTYSWTNNQTSIGLAANGTGNIPSFTATNIGTDPVVATIVVTPHFENSGVTCDGPTEAFAFTVNPTPVVSSESELSICSGEAANYTPTSNTVGTLFSWTASNTVGTVTGFTASGSGPISDVLTNAGGTDGKVVYVITPTGPAPTNCGGPDFYLEVTVVECNPIIGVAKQMVSVAYNIDGTYEVLYNIRVQNYGNLVLDSIQVTENLSTTFGVGNYTVLGLSSTSFDVNTSFAGVGNLLDNSGTTNVLAIGASTDIRLKVKVLSDGSYNNTVTASSTTGSVTDISQNGSDPDPDGDVLPGNNSIETPVVLISCDLTSSGIVNTTCNNSDGEVILTGSVAGTVTLNGVEKASPATYTGLQAGWYNATFAASTTGCISSTNFEITNSNSDLAGSVTFHKDVSCNSGSDGAVTVTATGGTGPYNYKLNGAVVATNVLTNLMAGEYGLQITDDNGCTYTVSFDIDEPTVLVSSIVSTSVSCNGGSDGTATVDVSGGTTPYSYLWDDGAAQATATATGLGAGTLYTVTITDDNGCQTSSTVTISAEICDPIAVDDNVITPEDTPVSGDVLSNDTDPGGLSLTVTQFVLGGTTYTVPSGGSNTASITGVGDLVINSDGTYTFTPVANYNGPVPAATYTITNGTNTDTADLNIVVTPVDDLPVVVDDSYTTAEDVSLTGDLGVNDTESGDGGNVWSVDTEPSHGTLFINIDGTFTYTPDANYTGSDSFTYKLCDADGDCDIATVDLTVSAVNDNPVAVDDFTPTTEDTPVQIDVLDNDNFGGDGPSATAITIVTQAINGTAVVNENGTPNDPTDDYVVYTPNPDFNGNDSFVYEICDSNGDCDHATSLVNVNGVDDSPVAVSDVATVTEDNILNGNLGSNDTESGDGGNVWSVVTNPSHGTVVVNIDGTFIYTPDENYNGSDSFSYKLCDGDGSCSTASVTLTVGPDNDPPIIADVLKEGPEDIDVPFVLSDFTSKFADVDGDALTQVELVTLPLNGTLNLNGTPVTAGDLITIAEIPNLTFTPDPNWNGETSFDWNGYDGNDWALLDEQVIITITPVNDPPVAGVSTMASQENPGGTDNVTVLANSFSGTDIDGTIASILITSMPSNATSITVDGITYTTIPGGGISVATTPTGQPLFDVEIDPVDGAVTSVLSYDVIDNEGLSSITPGTVSVPFSGIMTINAGVDAEICSSAISYNLAATATNYASLLWSTNGTGTFNFTNIEDPVYTPSIDDIATGQIQLTLTGTGVGGDIVLSDMMVLTVWRAASADAGPDTSICSNEPFVLTGATASDYATITWTSSGGTFDNPNALNPTFTPTATGNITITLTATGLGTCSNVVSLMTLTVYSPIVLATPIVADANCDSQEDGSVVLSVSSGGTGPFTFELSTGESNNTGVFGTLAAGGYVYWVTDANGCTAQGSFEVDDPNELELTVLSENDETCINDNNGSSSVTATGGTAPYTFVWSGTVTQASVNANPNTATDLEAGFYVVTVTDANGCQEIETLEIEEPTELNIVLVDQINADCDNSGQVIVNGTGGTPSYTYTSSSGTVSGNIVSDLSSGIDTIIITDFNACTDTLIVTIIDEDVSAPTFTCPETQQLYADINCQDTVPDLTALITDATDNCTGTDNVSIEQSVSAGTLISSDLTVTVTVSDSLGNSADCDVLLMMQDTTPPTPVCKDITLQLDMTGFAHISPEDVDGGSFDNCGLSSLAIDVTTFTCDSVGVNPVIMTVTDDSGNTKTCTAIVTIEDNVEPILDCPSPVTLIADGNCQAPTPDFASALSNNNCGSASVTQIPLAGSPLTVGVTMVTVVATDSENNSDTCFTAVTVVDETAPTFTCPETQILYSDINCQDTIPDLTVLITDAADNCTGNGNLIITQSIARGTLISSDISVTVSVSDSLGNSSSCDVLLVMQDTTPPTAICQNIEVQLDMTGWIHITPEDIDAGSYDNCGLSSMSIDFADFDCTQIGDNDIILTLTDDAGNISTCTSTVTITDNVDPILDCPAPITLNANSRCVALVPDYSDALSNNNCGSAVITQLPLAYTPIGLGEHIITITATDDAGNTDVCTTTVTVIDVTPPTFTCPETVIMGADANCEARVPFLTSRIFDARDNCGTLTLSQSIPGNTLISNDITLTVTATDNSGNKTSCDVLVRVRDDRPPVATCKDLTLQLDMTGQVYISPEDVDNGSFDNCGISSLSLDVAHFDCSSIGENTVYLTVTDDAGNVSTCFSRVTIEDNIDPILDCPAPVTLSADANCQAVIPDFTGARSTNNCGTATITQNPAAGTSVGEGVTIVTVIATDSEGNTTTCVTTVTVVDDTAPTFTCPETQKLYSDENCEVAVPDLTAMVTASDNCSSPIISQSVEAGTMISNDLTVTVTATDVVGNETRCDVLLEVRDTTPPAAICKNINLQLDMTGTVHFSPEDVDGGSTDNCGLASLAVDINTFTCDDTGANPVVLTVTDDAGNISTCNATVTIEDNINPILDCPPPVTLSAGTNCQAAIPDFTGALSSTNCGTVTITQSMLPGTLVSKGVTTVTITASDEAGNTAECAVNVTVIDTVSPEYTCSAPLAVNTDEGECFSNVSLEIPEVNDNCDSNAVSIKYRVYDPTNFVGNLMDTASLDYKFVVGINQVEWIMTDQSGNVSVCLQEVNVSEKEAPVITCPEGPFVFSNTIGECGFIVTDKSLDAFAIDNCSEVVVSHDYGDWAIPNSLQGATLPVGVTTVTWTATDAHGNSSSCSIDITVTDNQTPEFINCPSGSVFNVGLYNGKCEGGAIWSVPVATDNCSEVTVAQTRGPVRGTALAVGEYPIQYTATDGSGNKSYCNFTVNVTDTEDPVIVCQPDLIKENDFGECSWTSTNNSLSPLLANSNCPASVSWEVENPDGSVVSGIDDVSGYVFELGTSTVHYYISENVSGQDGACSFTVTVTDVEAPTLICPPKLQIVALPGDCSTDVNLLAPEIIDNCSNSANEVYYTVFSPDGLTSELISANNLLHEFKVGNNRVEWMVADEAGNVSFCWQDVWIVGYEDEAAVSAGQNVSILETGPFTVSGASAPDYAMVSWSSSGSGKFINAESVNTTYVPSATDLLDGFVVLTITSSTACTSVSDQMVLSFYKAPVVSAGADVEICEKVLYQLTGSILSDVVSVDWYVIGTGTLNDDQIANPIFTPSQEDIEAGEVSLVFVGRSSHAGLNSQDTMKIHISRQPIISAGEDAWLCKSESYLLANASLQFGEKVLWTTNGSGVFDDKTLLNATYFPSEADVINGGVVLTVSHETEGACASVSDEIILNIANHPTANAGQDRNTCFNQPIQIEEASAENFSSINWSTNGGGTIANANTLSPIYTPAADETGTVILTMQVIGENGCTTDTVYDEVTIEIYPLLVVDAGDDETIYYNKTTMLSVSVENGSGTYFYNWYPAGFVFEPNANYTETIELPRTIEFNVIVTDANTNCTASDIKTVYVDEDAGNIVSFYSGFSPNHDGINDTWSIKGIEKFPNNEVMFFNRWGDKVNEYQDYDNKTVAWDGTNNRGKPLPDGTYYYIVTLKNVDSFTGWVHIRTDR